MWLSLLLSSAQGLWSAQPMEEGRQITCSSKPLQSFPCSLGVSLSHGFCEQAATGTDFQHCCTSSLPKSAEFAPTTVLYHTIYSEVWFWPWAPYTADCHGFLTASEPLTDGKLEGSAQQNGIKLKSYCLLSVTVTFQVWEGVMTLALIIFMIIHLHKQYVYVNTYICI